MLHVHMRVSKNWGYLIGDLHNRDYSISGVYIGSPYFGKLPYRTYYRARAELLVTEHTECTLGQTCSIETMVLELWVVNPEIPSAHLHVPRREAHFLLRACMGGPIPQCSIQVQKSCIALAAILALVLQLGSQGQALKPCASIHGSRILH